MGCATWGLANEGKGAEQSYLGLFWRIVRACSAGLLDVDVQPYGVPASNKLQTAPSTSIRLLDPSTTWRLGVLVYIQTYRYRADRGENRAFLRLWYFPTT